MVKLLRLVKRRAGQDIETFRASWQEPYHALEATRSGPNRCVHSLPRISVYPRHEPPFDAVAELWFDDDEALDRFRTDPAVTTCLKQESALVEPERSIWLIVDDMVVKDGPLPPGAVKTVVAVHPRASYTPEAFHRYWREVHGPIGAALPHMCRYVQSHARAAAPLGGRPVEGCALTWFPSTGAIRASMQSPEWAALREDEPNLVEDDCPFVLTEETIVVDGER